MSPHNAVVQPVVEFGTAIHGKDFTGGALNRFQKPLHGQEFSSPSRFDTFPSSIHPRERNHQAAARSQEFEEG
jgi:hypothetical protein